MHKQRFSAAYGKEELTYATVRGVKTLLFAEDGEKLQICRESVKKKIP
jgi:hypothetical protein